MSMKRKVKEIFNYFDILFKITFLNISFALGEIFRTMLLYYLKLSQIKIKLPRKSLLKLKYCEDISSLCYIFPTEHLMQNNLQFSK